MRKLDFAPETLEALKEIAKAAEGNAEELTFHLRLPLDSNPTMPTWSDDTVICKSFSDPDQRILAAVCKNAIEVLGWLRSHKCWHHSPSEMSEMSLEDCLLRCSEDSIEGKFDLDNPPSLDDMQGEASAWASGATERLFETLNAVTGSKVGYQEIIRGAINFSDKLTK